MIGILPNWLEVNDEHGIAHRINLAMVMYICDDGAHHVRVVFDGGNSLRLVRSEFDAAVVAKHSFTANQPLAHFPRSQSE